MKFTFQERVKIKSGFHKGQEVHVMDHSGFWPFHLYVCCNEYGSNNFFSDGFWEWQLEKIEK